MSEPYFPTLAHEVTLISRESLPKSPGLYTPKRVTGRPVVRPRVLAYPISVKFMEAYAELHEIDVGIEMNYRRQKAYTTIFGRVPKSCCRTALVDTPVGVCGSVLLATNETAKDLRRADDLEMIHKVQRALGVSEPPKWYFPEHWTCFYTHNQTVAVMLAFIDELSLALGHSKGFTWMRG